MIDEGRFIPIKVKYSSNDDYIEYESCGDTRSKTISVTDYLGEIRQQSYKH